MKTETSDIEKESSFSLPSNIFKNLLFVNLKSRNSPYYSH